MSPSRGAVYRLFYASTATRPQCIRPQPSSWHFPSSSSSSSHRTLCVNSLSLCSSVHQAEDSRTSVLRKADDVGSSNTQLHSDGIDASLFESTTNEYQLAPPDHFDDVYHSGPSHLLQRLLAISMKDATKTLQELKKLQTPLEHKLVYANAARSCAAQNDFKGCLAWLEVIPNYSSIPEELICEVGDACDHLVSTLTILKDGSAEPYVACLALLKIIGKGYLVSLPKLHKALCRTLVWLLRHGKVLSQKEDEEWTWQLWKSLVKAASQAKALSAASGSSSTLDDTYTDKVILSRLSSMYNLSVRALALSGRYEAAILWVQNSDSIQDDSRVSETRLSSFTWRLFLEEVLAYDSHASAEVRGKAGVLVARLKERSSRSGQLNLHQEMSRLTLDKYENDVSDDGLLYNRVNRLLDQGNVKGSIAALQQALVDATPAPRWCHLPGAFLLARVIEAVSNVDRSWLREQLQFYLDDLRWSKAGNGLSEFAEMIQLSQDGRTTECISYCITTFQSKDIEYLALLIDETAFREVIQRAKATEKLRHSKHASYLALKNLVYMCRGDYFKLLRLYQAWLQCVAHHVGLTTSEKAVPTSGSIFEDNNLEYLFSTSAGLAEEKETSPPLRYETPPTARPSIYHFNLFLKMLPRSLAISKRRGSSSDREKIREINLHTHIVDLAFGILKEVERFKLEPTAPTWSILLSVLARNVNDNAPDQGVVGQQKDDSNGNEDEEEEDGITLQQALSAEDYENQWDRIWKLTSALGMGKSDDLFSSTLPRATAMTYAELIYAFLMVPPSRGGPCIEAANRVKSWFQGDTRFLSNLDHRTKERINEILAILEKEQASPEEREYFAKQKQNLDHIIGIDERLKLV